MCHTHITPHPPPPRSSLLLSHISLFSRRAKCQAFIRDKQLSPLLGGVEEKNQTEWRQKKREIKELWKREGKMKGKMQTEKAAKFFLLI